MVQQMQLIIRNDSQHSVAVNKTGKCIAQQKYQFKLLVLQTFVQQSETAGSDQHFTNSTFCWAQTEAAGSLNGEWCPYP